MTQADASMRLGAFRDVAAGYARLARSADRHAWPGLALVAVAVEAAGGLEPPRDVEGDGVGEGWFRFQSAAWRTDEPKPAAVRDGSAGRILAAEWASGDASASVHLRQDPDRPGTLRRWRYAERALPQDGELLGGELPALRQRVAVLARAAERAVLRQDRDQPTLVYHVFWGGSAEDPWAVRRLFARFVGFGRERLVESPRPSGGAYPMGVA